MGKINGCIKYLFISFNVVFAILACVLIYLAVDVTGFTRQMAAIALCLTLGLEEYWKKPPVETTVDDFNRVKYQPKPSLT